jgi:hypothetical protein
MPGQTCQTGPVIQIPRKHFPEDSRFGFIPLHPGRITRSVRVDAVPIGHLRPGQQGSGLQFPLTAPPHPFRNQRALIPGDRPADLQQQLIMRVAAHGPIQELDRAADVFEFLQQHHLMHVVARQTIGCRQQHPIQFAGLGFVPQLIQPGPIQGGAANAVIPKDVLVEQLSTLALDMALQPLQLLFDGLGLRLSLGRHAHIDRE